SCNLPLTAREAMEARCPSCRGHLPALEELYPESASTPWYPPLARQARPAGGGGAAGVLFVVAGLQLLGGLALMWLAFMHNVPLRALSVPLAVIGVIPMVCFSLPAGIGPNPCRRSGPPSSTGPPSAPLLIGTRKAVLSSLGPTRTDLPSK